MKSAYLFLVAFNCFSTFVYCTPDPFLPYEASILLPNKTKLYTLKLSSGLYYYLEKINTWNSITFLLANKDLKHHSSNTQLRQKISALFDKYNYKEEIQLLKKSEKWDKYFLYGSLALLLLWGGVMADHAYSLKQPLPKPLS